MTRPKEIGTCRYCKNTIQKHGEGWYTDLNSPPPAGVSLQIECPKRPIEGSQSYGRHEPKKQLLPRVS
ncbi:hypothetical protein [Nonomuraea typhae]|uniref:hypothetical protein n=1 Tax=Nonomuraea typhae TaxID=2603600 RepID=UPI0012FA76AE|nr:hypothetical protein [Nonomuraea typhae]